VAEIKAGMIASRTGRELTIDQPLLDALVEARDDNVLAALVYEIGAAGRMGRRFPDSLLQALVGADWTSALSLYRDDGVLNYRPSPPSTERARPRRQAIPELAQSPSMRRHASSHFPGVPEKVIGQIASGEEDRAASARGDLV
jgi:hypothetical protein